MLFRVYQTTECIALFRRRNDDDQWFWFMVSMRDVWCELRWFDVQCAAFQYASSATFMEPVSASFWHWSYIWGRWGRGGMLLESPSILHGGNKRVEHHRDAAFIPGNTFRWLHLKPLTHSNGCLCVALTVDTSNGKGEGEYIEDI